MNRKAQHALKSYMAKNRIKQIYYEDLFYIDEDDELEGMNGL